MKLPRSFPALFIFILSAARVGRRRTSPRTARGDHDGQRAALRPRAPWRHPDGVGRAGEIFEGWKLTDYNQAADSVALSKDGAEVTLQLSSSVILTPAAGGGRAAPPPPPPGPPSPMPTRF